MRTDLKIGLVVGFVLILIVFIYFVSQDREASRRPIETTVGPATRPVGSVGTVELKSGVVARTPDKDARIGQKRPVPKREAKDRPVIVPRPAPLFETVPLRPSGPERGTGLARSPTTRPSLRPIPAIPVSPTAWERPTEKLKPRIYIVRAGDAGFWGVAEKVYGHGKYWTHIRRANPGVDSNTLAPGKRLVIPPLPTKPTRRGAAVKDSPIRPAPGIQQIYTVQPGDNGFWGVAKKVYGDGRYYELIAEANPKADTLKLRAGQKLIIPPLGDLPVPARSVARRREPQELPSGDDHPIFD